MLDVGVAGGTAGRRRKMLELLEARQVVDVSECWMLRSYLRPGRLLM